MFRDLSCALGALVGWYAAAGCCLAQAGAAEDPVYAIAEKMPEFPGGQPALRAYLVSHFEYPEEAMDAPVNGPVQVSFVVTKEGAIRDAHVVRGQHPALDEEALRLVRGMPPWIPGQQHGMAANVLYTMPIRFATPPSGAPAQRTAQAPANGQ